MPFVAAGVLQIAPLSFGKQSLGIMVTFLSNSLLEINTSSILLIFLIEKELLVYLIYCIRLKKVSSFTLKAITSSINVFLLCKISNNFVHIHAILILMKTEHASGI